MTAAATQLKKSFKAPELNINKIDKLADDMADLMANSQDIQDALGRNYAVPDGIDEDELLGELDGLEDELSAEKEAAPEGAMPSYLLDAPTDLPSAPVGAPAGAEMSLPAAPARMV